MITLEQAKKLGHGDILHHVREANADGTPVRARVNGKVQLWKTRPSHFRIPVKYGLKECFYIIPEDIPVYDRRPTDNLAEDWELT